MTELLRQLLVETSYDIQFRRDQWIDCLVSNGRERWRGRGSDEDEALEDVIGQMMPSVLGRQLLAERLSACSPALAVAAPETPALQAVEAPEVLVPVLLEAVESAAPLSIEAAPLAEAPEEPAPSSDPVHAVASPTSGAPISDGADVAASASGGRSLRVLATAKTQRGAGGEHREDACVAVPERGLVVVADGVGVGPGGAIAAATAVETVRKALEGDAPLSPVRRKGLPLLLAAIQEANTTLFEAGRRDPALQGKTSLAAALDIGRQAIFAHVGDSRIYRLRRTVLELLTTDHTTGNRRSRSGPASTRALATRALGTHRKVEVDSSVVTSQPGDVLLLCTDGLHGAVTHQQLSDLLAGHRDPRDAVEHLLAQARASGAADNVTAAVVCWES